MVETTEKKLYWSTSPYPACRDHAAEKRQKVMNRGPQGLLGRSNNSEIPRRFSYQGPPGPPKKKRGVLQPPSLAEFLTCSHVMVWFEGKVGPFPFGKLTAWLRFTVVIRNLPQDADESTVRTSPCRLWGWAERKCTEAVVLGPADPETTLICSSDKLRPSHGRKLFDRISRGLIRPADLGCDLLCLFLVGYHPCSSCLEVATQDPLDTRYFQ